MSAKVLTVLDFNRITKIVPGVTFPDREVLPYTTTSGNLKTV